MTKILVIGGSGLLGSNILYVFQNKFDITYTVNEADVDFKGKKLRVNLLENFEEIKKLQFDVLVNAVALTNVDICEKDPDLAFKLNAQIPEKLARYCKENEAYLIHISTDQIFSGEEEQYDESSKPDPINVYGKTKLQGELAIQNILGEKNFTIFRTNFFGINCINKLSFSEWILDSLKNKKEIKMFPDVFFNPVLVQTLVRSIEVFIKNPRFGTFDLTSDRKISKYEFGVLLKDVFNLSWEIKKSSVDDMDFLARRPKNMFLSNDKIKKVLGIEEIGIEKELEALYNLYEENYPQDLKKHASNN